MSRVGIYWNHSIGESKSKRIGKEYIFREWAPPDYELHKVSVPVPPGAYYYCLDIPTDSYTPKIVCTGADKSIILQGQTYVKAPSGSTVHWYDSKGDHMGITQL